jgi:hypothetical protein
LSGRWLSRRCRWIPRSWRCCPIEGGGGCCPLTRNGRTWGCGHCLGGSSGRGIGATAPGALGRLPFPSTAPSAPVGGYRGRKLYCRQIRSFTRAQELLRQGHNYLDRDGDGVACESLR